MNYTSNVWVLAFVLNFFEAIIYFELLQLPLFCCFRGNAEKKMLFYPKELRVSMD